MILKFYEFTYKERHLVSLKMVKVLYEFSPKCTEAVIQILTSWNKFSVINFPLQTLLKICIEPNSCEIINIFCIAIFKGGVMYRFPSFRHLVSKWDIKLSFTKFSLVWHKTRGIGHPKSIKLTDNNLTYTMCARGQIRDKAVCFLLMPWGKAWIYMFSSSE